MAKKVVSLYLEDSSLRLLVIQGQRIKNWADLPLAPGLVRNGAIIKEDEVAEHIRQLLKSQKVKAKKVIVGLSGLHCLSRPMLLPQLPRAMLAEAVVREARRVLPVPVEDLYLSWQALPTTEEGKTQVFVVGIPRKTADALIKMLDKLGLMPYLMDIKPLALARVVRQDTAVLVDVQSTEFDIVIVAGGIPQPIRTMAFPEEKLSWTDKLTRIGDELEKTIKFYNSNNPEKPLGQTVPIFVSGELADQPELYESLAADLGYPFSQMSPPFPCPEILEANRYLANMGLILKESSLDWVTTPLVPNPNLLPEPYRPKPPSLKKVLALPGAVAIIGLVVPFSLLIQGASADSALIRGKLDTANQQLKQRLAQKQELTDSIAKLKKTIADTETATSGFATALKSLERASGGASGDMDAAVRNLSGAMMVTHLGLASNVLTISGRAPAETDVLGYVKRLNATGRFPEITVAGVKKIEGKGVDFTLILKTGGKS